MGERKSKRERLSDVYKNWLYISIPDRYKLKGLLTHLLEQWQEYYSPLWEPKFNKFMTVDHKLTHIKDVFLFASRLYFDITRRCGKRNFLKDDKDKFDLIMAIWLHDWGNHGPIYDVDNETQELERLNIFLEKYGGDKLDSFAEMDDPLVRMNHAIISYFNIQYHPDKVGLDLLDRMTGSNARRGEIAALCLHQKRIPLGERAGLNALLRLLDACDEIWSRLISYEQLNYRIWETTLEANKIWKKIVDFLKDENLHRLGIDDKKLEEIRYLCYKKEIEKILEIVKDNEALKELEEYLNKYKHYQFKEHVIPKMAIEDVYFYKGEIIIVPFFKEFASEDDPDIQVTIGKIRRELEEGEEYLKLLSLPFDRNSVRLWRIGDPQPEELEVKELRESFSTFEVRNPKELAELENKGDFLESPLRGKFIDKPISWLELKEKIIRESFSSFEWKVAPPNIADSPFRIFFITGRYGVGKSTFMLYWLDQGLSSERSWFKSVVFLDPNEMGSEEGKERILEDLYFNLKEDPENVILAVDALYREGDTKDKFEEKYQFLNDLAKRFKIIVTLRDSDYELLKKFPINFRDKTIELKPTKKSTELILLFYLDFYCVNYDKESPEFHHALSLLHQKRDGNLPYYINHLVKMLYLREKKFSKEAVEEVPDGMVELILYTIDKELLLPDEKTIPFIIQVLLKQRKSLPLSLHFLSWIAEKYSKKENEKRVISNLEILRRTYLDTKPFKFEKGPSIERYQLDEVWKTSLEQVIKEPEKFDKFKFAQYFCETYVLYDNFKHDLIVNLGEYLDSAFKKSPSYDEFSALSNLLVDLAKFDNTKLRFVTDLFNRTGDRITWSDNQLNYIKTELSLAWFLSALDLRDENKYPDAKAHAEEASRIKEDFKQARHFFVHLLEKDLAKVKREDGEVLIKKIEGEYARLVDIDPKDYVTWQARSIFYKKIGEYEKAEECFEESLKLGPEHVPILQAYGIFCNEMGNRLWNRDRENAEKYYNKARGYFERGIDIARKTEFSEAQILNAYAEFLVDLAGKTEQEDKRIELYEKADDVYKEIVEKKYPNHIQSRNAYANFLIEIAGRWLKGRYPKRDNLKRAENVLTETIKKYADPIAQNILARLLYKIYVKYEKAKELLEESAKNPNAPILHEQICYHEIGKLLIRWAGELDIKEERESKIKLAREYLNKSKNLPENNSTYHHLSKVHMSLAYLYARFYKNATGARSAKKYARKGIEFAEKAERTPLYLSYFLINQGEEVLEEEPKIALFFYDKASQIDRNSYWAYFRKGQCHSKIAEVEDFEKNMEAAIDNYHKSAEIQNTIRAYASVRNALKESVKGKLMLGNESLWKKCLENMKLCSEKIIELGSIDWRDYINYSQDLMELGRFLAYTNVPGAIEHFEKAHQSLKQIEKLLQDTRLLEPGFINEYSWFLSHKDICEKWITTLESMKQLSSRREQLLQLDRILDLDRETCEKTGDIQKVKEILKEYFDLLFPFEDFDHQKLRMLGEKFFEYKEYDYARKCFELSIRLCRSSENLLALMRANMRLGKFEDAIGVLSRYGHSMKIGKVDTTEPNVRDLLKKCESAIHVKDRISEGLILLIKIAKAVEMSTPQELAYLYFDAGKTLLQLKEEIDLRPLIYAVADRYIFLEELKTIKSIMIPNKIIRSCFWRAKELNPHIFLKEAEQTFQGFKIQSTNAYLYTAQQLQTQAENAKGTVELAKFIKAAFYYLYFLSLKSEELQHDKKKLSETWGKTGGSLVKINNGSLFKISRHVITECFQQSVVYDDENKDSWGQLGRQLFEEGKYEDAEIALNKSDNEYSLTTLGEIAELRQEDKIKARDCYINASEIMKSKPDDENKSKSLKNIAERLAKLGFREDALEIYKTIKELSSGRKKILTEAKIAFLERLRMKRNFNN